MFNHDVQILVAHLGFLKIGVFLSLALPPRLIAWCLYFSPWSLRTLHSLEDFPAPCINHNVAYVLSLFERSVFLILCLPARPFAEPIDKEDSPPFVFR